MTYCHSVLDKGQGKKGKKRKEKNEKKPEAEWKREGRDSSQSYHSRPYPGLGKGKAFASSGFFCTGDLNAPTG